MSDPPPSGPGVLLSVSEERVRSERERAEAAETYDRQIRHETVAFVLICWGWVLLGSWCVALSARTTDMMASQILERVGPGVGFGGIYFTAVAWFVRRSERGDFG